MSPPARRLVVIYNATAGSADDSARRAALSVLRRRADVVEAAIGRPDDLPGALGEHPGRDPVAVGGDGTVHLLVAALARRDELAGRTVGLIPLGTGNDLARALDIPPDPAAAAEVVLGGRERWLDLLVDDTGGIAVNAVHFGVGADASAAATSLKPVLRRLAYLAGGVIAGARTAGWRLRVEVDGRVVADGRRRVLMVGISNGSTIGGGAPLAPAADPGDTRADVTISFATGPLQRLAYGLLLRTGRHGQREDVVSLRGRVVRVQGEPVRFNADGEIGEPVAERTWRLMPRAWRMTVPEARAGRATDPAPPGARAG